MRILKTYEDGSQSKLYEAGDEIVATQTIYTGWYPKSVPVGTVGKVIKCTVTYPENWEGVNIEPYYVEFNGCTFTASQFQFALKN